MADKKLNAVSTAKDGAYIYAEDASGNQIKISKADLATVVAGMIDGILFPTKTYTLQPGEEVNTGFSNFGLYLMRTNSTGQTALVLVGTSPDVSILLGSESTFTTDLNSTTSRFVINRKTNNGTIYIKNISTIERHFQIRMFKIL